MMMGFKSFWSTAVTPAAALGAHAHDLQRSVEGGGTRAPGGAVLFVGWMTFMAGTVPLC